MVSCNDNEGETEAENELQELKRQNAERWAKLKSLHLRNEGGNDEGEATDEDEPTSKPPINDNIPDFDGDPRAFLREVVETYDELVQTKAILEQRLQHDRRDLDDMRFLLLQNRELNAGLDAKKEVSDANDDAISGPEQIAIKKNQIDEEHQWLTRELSYVANLVESDHARGSGTFWSFEQLLNKLLEATWNKDPWVLTAAQPIHPKHLEILHQYHVVQSHHLDPDLICLRDYLAGVL